jgi:hypothetical protein
MYSVFFMSMRKKRQGAVKFPYKERQQREYLDYDYIYNPEMKCFYNLQS